MGMYVFAYLSVCEHISKTTCQNFTIFSVSDRGLVFFSNQIKSSDTIKCWQTVTHKNKQHGNMEDRMISINHINITIGP